MNFYIKVLSVITILPLLIFTVQAEVPNAGFENWNNGEPDGWATSNVPGQVTNVIQSSNAHSGTSAAELSVVDIGLGFGVPPLLSSLDSGGNFYGFPISQAYQELTGYYQLNPMGSSLLQISINLFNITGTDTLAVGFGAFVTGSAASSYTPFSAQLFYFPGFPQPNWAWIIIQITDTTTGLPAVGSSALIDDLAFQGIVGIEDQSQDLAIQDYILEQNYPNPFNPSTQINFSLPITSEVQIVIYDQIGREVDRLQQGQLSAGNHSITWSATDLPSGIYYYQLQAGGRKMTRKMMLMK